MLTDPFSSKKPLRTKTNTANTTSTSGSAEGQAAGQWGINQYQDMINSGAPTYAGPNPYATGPNQWQQQQGETLGGLQDAYAGEGGYWDQAQGIYQNVGGMNAQNIGPMDRSGGPGAGYMNPYQDEVLGGLEKDYGKSLEMGVNQIGAGATGVGAFGGSRHGAAEGVMGASAMDNYLKQASGVRSDSYDKGMQYMGQDQNRNIQIAQANNQANLGFGNMQMNAASGMSNVDNQLNLSNAQGAYGNYQDQKDIEANNWLKGNWDQQQNRNDNYMTGYTNAVNATPWQNTTTSSTTGKQTGQGKSNLDKTIGYATTAAGIKMYMACIPEGTKIDTADGPVAIEDIKAGDKVIGYSGEETEVLQAHQYKEDPVPTRFATVTFENSAKVDCCDMHRINGRRTKDYKVGDKVGSRTITNITWYNGVERSYDLLTEDGGYMMSNIPVDSMIEELADMVQTLKAA